MPLPRRHCSADRGVFSPSRARADADWKRHAIFSWSREWSSVQLIVETRLGSPSRARGAGRSPDNRPTGEFLATRSPLYKTALCVVSRWHAVSGRWTVMRAPFLHIGEYLLRAREGIKLRAIWSHARGTPPCGHGRIVAARGRPTPCRNRRSLAAQRHALGRAHPAHRRRRLSVPCRGSPAVRP
jgi:hypothetical protein